MCGGEKQVPDFRKHAGACLMGGKSWGRLHACEDRTASPNRQSWGFCTCPQENL